MIQPYDKTDGDVTKTDETKQFGETRRRGRWVGYIRVHIQTQAPMTQNNNQQLGEDLKFEVCSKPTV